MLINLGFLLRNGELTDRATADLIELYRVPRDQWAQQLFLEGRSPTDIWLLCHLQLWLPTSWCTNGRAARWQVAPPEIRGGTCAEPEEAVGVRFSDAMMITSRMGWRIVTYDVNNKRCQDGYTA